MGHQTTAAAVYDVQSNELHNHPKVAWVLVSQHGCWETYNKVPAGYVALREGGHYQDVKTISTTRPPAEKIGADGHGLEEIAAAVRQLLPEGGPVRMNNRQNAHHLIDALQALLDAPAVPMPLRPEDEDEDDDDDDYEDDYDSSDLDDEE